MSTQNILLIISLQILTIIYAEAKTYIFSNQSIITLPVNGPAQPYPSVIEVKDIPLNECICKVYVELLGVKFVFTSDLEIALISPSQKCTILCAGYGNGFPFTNAKLQFLDKINTSLCSDKKTFYIQPHTWHDEHSSYIPKFYDVEFKQQENIADELSGKEEYSIPFLEEKNELATTNLTRVSLHSTLLDLCACDSPNGEWKLLVQVDNSHAVGSIESWNLIFITTKKDLQNNNSD